MGRGYPTHNGTALPASATQPAGTTQSASYYEADWLMDLSPQTVNCQDKSRRPARARVSMQLIHGPSSSFELTFLE